MARPSRCGWRRLRRRRPMFTRGCLQWLSATRTASRFKSALRIGRVRSRSGTSGRAGYWMRCSRKWSRASRERRMLTVSTLRSILAAAIGKFVPTAYYDKHMDCIRVITHDRSVTEHRLDGFFTICECNNRGPLDPEYVGFVIKGVRHLFAEVG